MKADQQSHKYEMLLEMLHSVTKMDVQFVDLNGVPSIQYHNYSIPEILHRPTDEFAHIHGLLEKHEPGYYYNYVNPYGLEYMAAGLWVDRSYHGFIFLGPFLSSLSITHLIREIIASNQLPIGERQSLEHFYESLPVLSDTEHQHIGTLLGHLSIHHTIRSRKITSHTDRPLKRASLQHITLEESKQLIEQRYEHQNKLMDAITQGHKEKAISYVNILISALGSFSDRVPSNQMRVFKNMGFVLNTMCRIAAERSGVHPVYLHNISDRFAIMIERTTSIPQIKELYQTMADDYCDLVNTAATGHYSHIVKKAVDYILLNLGSPLQLKQIAEHVHVNPSHLSRTFKEDTGMTITEFINRKRIEEAAIYLKKSNLSVTEVAFMVGFNDLNYFSKVFKKYMSVTPTQYSR